MTGLVVVLVILAVVEGLLLWGAARGGVQREDALHTAWWSRVKLCRKYYGWLQGANKRRKRVEAILRREVAKHEARRKGIFDIATMLSDSLVENANLKVQNSRVKEQVATLENRVLRLENHNRVLAADVTSQLLAARDREEVTKGLTRKL